ncbi:ATP-binding cassette domain-containing protein [Escherichia coli]|nr:ATP-binding cassette domain-containing protein [Escherichia coli]
MVSSTTPSSGEYLLEMSGINKSFPGVKALDNVNLKVRPHSIHALMGENGAGKSTLLKCLFGIYQKDSGTILFQGKEIDFHSAKEALENGISMVHQELNLVLQRSVMDNMWLGRYPTKGMFVDQDKMYRETKAIFDELDIDIDPRARVGTLSVSQMQMIEIAKAFSYNAKIVIMDEPTSSLTEKEVNHLFTIIRKLKERGCGIVYISHKMEEIFQLCDEVTVLRDGQWIATEPLAGLTMDKIIAMMVGRSLNQRFPDKENKPGEVILEVRNLTSLRQPSIRDVSFDLHKGEILGIAGLVGAKRTDIVETLFGIREKSAGTITLHGKQISFRLSYITFYALIAVAFVWVLWNKTRFGKNIFAIGGNPEAAKVSGVNVGLNLLMIYALSGVFYAFGGMLEAGRIGSATNNLGFMYELDAIAACVVGGVSFSGGVGTVIGVVTGVIIFTVINYGLTYIGVNPYWQYIIKGAIIIFAVALDSLKYARKK